MQIIYRIIPIIIVLALGYWGTVRLFSEEKTTKKRPPRSQSQSEQAKKRNNKKPAQETTASTLVATDYQVNLSTQGVVKARINTSLTPLVAGRIIKVTDKFQDGAFFQQGDVLVELDPVDFESQIITSEASLARAEASLAQEEARAAQALRNWQDIGFDEEPNDLVLRKPQLKEARANVAAQQASLARAKRNLERTKITAPFSGRVRSRSAGLGQSVGANTKLGEIYATDYAEVRLPLSAKQLTMITINEQGDQEIPVTLTDALNPSNKTTWTANIKHVEGELNEASRELFVIAKIIDPFAIHNTDSDKAKMPIRMNQPVIASILADTLKGSIIIDRKYLYGTNEILLIKEDKIVRHTIDAIWSTPDHIIVNDPELNGQLIATSRLSYANTGTPVTIVDPDNKTATATPKLDGPKPRRRKKR